VIDEPWELEETFKWMTESRAGLDLAGSSRVPPIEVPSKLMPRRRLAVALLAVSVAEVGENSEDAAVVLTVGGQ
jgi:hypothetical protein